MKSVFFLSTRHSVTHNSSRNFPFFYPFSSFVQPTSRMDEFHYEEVHLSEMSLDGNVLRFPCPCGDLFELLLDEFVSGNDVAQCPTCSLTIKILFTEEEKNAFLRGVSQPSSSAAVVA